MWIKQGWNTVTTWPRAPNNSTSGCANMRKLEDASSAQQMHGNQAATASEGVQPQGPKGVALRRPLQMHSAVVRASIAGG
eukprot:6323770-Alexandrium_andersonii.AAC.1